MIRNEEMISKGLIHKPPRPNHLILSMSWSMLYGLLFQSLAPDVSLTIRLAVAPSALFRFLHAMSTLKAVWITGISKRILQSLDTSDTAI